MHFWFGLCASVSVLYRIYFYNLTVFFFLIRVFQENEGEELSTFFLLSRKWGRRKKILNLESISIFAIKWNDALTVKVVKFIPNCETFLSIKYWKKTLEVVILFFFVEHFCIMNTQNNKMIWIYLKQPSVAGLLFVLNLLIKGEKKLNKFNSLHFLCLIAHMPI